jgi:curved DNA-binding protein CbpA
VEVTTARQILGVRAGDGWEVVRAAYRAQIREAHPDVAGAGGVDRTVELNAAYRTLSLAKREGRLDQPAT